MRKRRPRHSARAPKASVDPDLVVDDIRETTEQTLARTEMVLAELHRSVERLDQRVGRIETLLDERIGTEANLDEVLDVRLHSARLAAELRRVTVELEARIDSLANQPVPTPTPSPASATRLMPSGADRGWIRHD